MSEQIFLNGGFVAKEGAKVSVMDRGFLFGDGVYELIPVYNSNPFLLDDHLSRLDKSLNAIEMSDAIPNDTNIKKIIGTLIEKNKYKNHFIYIQITRGSDAVRQHIYQPTTQPTIVIMGQSYETLTHNQIQKGCKATIHEDYRWKRANIKSTSLLGNVLLKNYAARQGMYETLLVYKNKITEGSASNIFIVREGKIITPKLGKELLSGITRSLILKLLKDNQNDVAELDVSKEEIISADEVWCSSSTNPVVPITEIDTIPVKNGKAGKITLETYQLVSKFIKEFGK